MQGTSKSRLLPTNGKEMETIEHETLTCGFYRGMDSVLLSSVGLCLLVGWIPHGDYVLHCRRSKWTSLPPRYDCSYNVNVLHIH